MAPDTWLTILFAVLTVAGYLLWVLELLPGLRVLIALLAIVCFALALVFYERGDRSPRDPGPGMAAVVRAGAAS
jgi:hypothetical protein